MLWPQELTLDNAHGNPAARSVEEFKWCWWCTRSFVAEDEAGRAQYHLQASECSSSRGCNVLAPSCCNENYDMDVWDAYETKV